MENFIFLCIDTDAWALTEFRFWITWKTWAEVQLFISFVVKVLPIQVLPKSVESGSENKEQYGVVQEFRNGN